MISMCLNRVVTALMRVWKTACEWMSKADEVGKFCRMKNVIHEKTYCHEFGFSHITPRKCTVLVGLTNCFCLPKS